MVKEGLGRAGPGRSVRQKAGTGLERTLPTFEGEGCPMHGDQRFEEQKKPYGLLGLLLVSLLVYLLAEWMPGQF